VNSYLEAPQLVRAPSAGPGGTVFAFLPGKPGSGASTVCAHLAEALAGILSAGAIREPVSLVEFDLYSGALAFLLNADNELGVAHLAMHAGRMDQEWENAVSKSGQLEALVAGTYPGWFRMEAHVAGAVTDLAAARSKAVFCDLSGNLEPFSLEVLRRARTVYVVVTADLASLYLARRRILRLHELGLRERVHVILNRFNKSERMTPRMISEALDVGEILAIDDDDQAIQTALREGKMAAASTRFGAGIRQLALKLASSITSNQTVG